MLKYMYRYHDYSWRASLPIIILATYDIIRETPKGYVIDVFGEEKFINISHKKQFAYINKEAAYIGFVKRKFRQLKILQAQIKRIDYLCNQLNNSYDFESLQTLINMGIDEDWKIGKFK